MKTYAVLGSNSFTGSHIVDALLSEPDNRVIGISRSPEYKDFFLPYKGIAGGDFRFCQIDMVRRFDDLVKLLDEVKPQIVINVAALSEVAMSNERPAEYFETNTLSVVRLCEYLRGCNYLERYVHISSGEIFGSCETPVTEDDGFRPSTPYAVSKAAADMHLDTLLKNFGFPVYIIRSTNVYGRHQQLFKIIPRTVIYLKMGKTIELQGGGGAAKSFIHIRDVVRGLMLATGKGSPGTYHFTVADDESIANIVRRVCGMMGYEFESATRSVGDRLGQDARYWLDCSKAKHELGWSPQEDFQQGVGEVIDWVEDNWVKIRLEPLSYVHKS